MKTSTYHDLLSLLHSGASLTYEEASGWLRVDKRHVRRLIKVAKEKGEAIEEGKRGREKLFSIPEHRRRKGVRIEFDQEELEALSLSAEAVGSTLGASQFGDALGRAIEKIRRASIDPVGARNDGDEEDREWFFSPHPKANLEVETVRALRTAIVERRSIEISYFSGGRQVVTERTIDPYAIAVLGTSWMVVGWCHMRQEFRVFSLPDIRSIAPGEPFLRKDFDVDDHFSGSFGGVRGEEEVEISLLFDKQYLRAFRRKTFHPSQEVEELDDGTVRATFRVSGLDGFRAWVLSWGAKVIVQTEGEFRATVVRELRQAAAQYDAGDGED